MNFSFKKFLPKIMNDTLWGELIEVWQSIYQDIKDDVVFKIFNQYDLDNIGEQDLIDLSKMFGWDLLYLTGYTSTFEFLKKEVELIIPRLVTKSTPFSFILTGVPFNLISNGYSVIYNEDEKIYIGDETLTGTSIVGTVNLDREDQGFIYERSITGLDRGLTLDATPTLKSDEMYKVSVDPPPYLSQTTLDAVEFPKLDGSLLLYSLTRNFIFSYTHKFIENSNEFMSINTQRVLMNDIDQIKKVTNRCYYEPYLHINLKSDKTQTDKVWTDYQGNTLYTQKSILITDNLSQLRTIRFGNSKHNTIDTSITDVDNFIYEWNFDLTNIIIQEPNHYIFRFNMNEMQKLSPFTEICILNESDEIIMYSEFPKVQWHPNMYCNLKFELKII
jgi:hypothetical protein